jgi:hypothetical protein
MFLAITTIVPSMQQCLQAFMRTLGTSAQAGGGPFAPKPLFWERPTFLLWTAAQDDSQKTEEDFAAADPEFAQLKQKYDRSRKTVTRTGESPLMTHLYLVSPWCLMPSYSSLWWANVI